LGLVFNPMNSVAITKLPVLAEPSQRACRTPLPAAVLQGF
jgi:hypothetical protein